MENKKKGPDPYQDMLMMPHHVSTRHPSMSMTERAAQFSPFAALTGFGDAVGEEAGRTESRPELTEAEKEEIDRLLRQAAFGPAQDRPEIEITYFVSDERKEGGSLRTLRGRILRVDGWRRELVFASGERVGIETILQIAMLDNPPAGNPPLP